MAKDPSSEKRLHTAVYEAIQPARPFELLGDKQICAPDYYQSFPCPLHSCLICFLQGSGTLTHNGEQYFPKAGDVVFLKAGKSWEYFCNPNDPWHIIWINAKGRLPMMMAETYRLSDVTYFPDLNAPRLFEDFLTQQSQRYHGRGERADQLLSIYLQILQMLAQVYYEGGHFIANTGAFYVKDYIDFHYEQPLTNKNFSEMSNYSVSNLGRLFRHTYGITPLNYLTQVRLTHAAEKLRESNQSIGTIATSVGFPDVRYFCRRFRNLYGCSPSVYRQKNRQNASAEEKED